MKECLHFKSDFHSWRNTEFLLLVSFLLSLSAAGKRTFLPPPPWSLGLAAQRSRVSRKTRTMKKTTNGETALWNGRDIQMHSLQWSLRYRSMGAYETLVSLCHPCPSSRTGGGRPCSIGQHNLCMQKVQVQSLTSQGDKSGIDIQGHRGVKSHYPGVMSQWSTPDIQTATVVILGIAISTNNQWGKNSGEWKVVIAPQKKCLPGRCH